MKLEVWENQEMESWNEAEGNAHAKAYISVWTIISFVATRESVLPKIRSVVMQRRKKQEILKKKKTGENEKKADKQIKKGWSETTTEQIKCSK